MAYYRLYHLHDGRIRRFDEIEAEDDEDAIAQIQSLQTDRDVELWCEGRKVVFVPLHRARQA